MNYFLGELFSKGYGLRLKIFLAAILLGGMVSVAACAGGSHAKSGDLEAALKSSSEVTLEDVFGKEVKDAYVFCQYAESKDGSSRGFPEDQFFSLRRDYKKWESYTGIGVVFRNGDAKIFWFSPKEINACPGGNESLIHLGGDSVIKTSTETRTFSDGSQSDVNVLHY